MKRTFLIISCAAVLAACGSKNTPPTDNNNDKDSNEVTVEYFGDTITEENAIKGEELLTFMADKDSAEVKVEAKIAEVCQKKGCWMDIDLGNGELMNVKFLDYEFFVPKDAGGKTAVLEGWCYKTVETVEWLKHKAEDAEKPQEEIDAITEPDTTYGFMANGVIIK